MRIQEWYYLFVAGLVNFIFIINYRKFLKMKPVNNQKSYFLLYIGSFLSAWGIDIVQKLYDIETLDHVLRVSLGSWLCFYAAIEARNYFINQSTPKAFIKEAGGELVGFVLMGLVIFILT